MRTTDWQTSNIYNNEPMEPTTKRTRTSRRRRTKHQDRGSATGEPARPSGHGGAKGAISRPPTLIGHAEIRSICCNTWVRPLQGTRCFLLLSLVGDAPFSTRPLSFSGLARVSSFCFVVSFGVVQVSSLFLFATQCIIIVYNYMLLYAHHHHHTQSRIIFSVMHERTMTRLSIIIPSRRRGRTALPSILTLLMSGTVNKYPSPSWPIGIPSWGEKPFASISAAAV